MWRLSLVLTASTFFILLSAVFAGVFAQENVPNPCVLFTKEEAEMLFRETVSDGRTVESTLPAAKICKYSFKKKGGVYGVAIKISTTDALKQEGFYSSAKDVFTRQKKARMSSEETAKRMKAIQGLGDESFWNGYDLWIVMGDHFINIAVNSFLDGSFENTEAMQKQRYEQDLELSLKVAESVIAKIR